MQIAKIFLSLVLCSWMVNAIASTAVTELNFFNKKLPVSYESTMVFDFPYHPNEDGFFEYYFQRADTCPHQVFLESLKNHKSELGLNDWLYFNLLDGAINSIFSSQKEHMRHLFLWFMLNKAGYETQLEFKGKEVTVSVLTFDLVYGVPQSKGRGGYFIDLTSFGNQIDYKKWEPFRLNFNPNKGKKTIPFQFSVKETPKVFDSRIVEKKISFSAGGRTYELAIPVDQGYVEFLKDYPELSVLKHTEICLSASAYEALIPFLKKETSGMDSVQVIRFIMSFCRTGFKSKPREKTSTPYIDGPPMRVISAPEEVLFSDYADTEDISVLFYYLAKEVLNPEMVFLKFGKEVSVAVNLHKKTGNPLMYNAKPYVICDVSENSDSTDIGFYPRNLAGKTPSFMEK